MQENFLVNSVPRGGERIPLPYTESHLLPNMFRMQHSCASLAVPAQVRIRLLVTELHCLLHSILTLKAASNIIFGIHPRNILAR